MKAISFTDANKDFKSVLDTVNNDVDVVFVNRKNYKKMQLLCRLLITIA